MTRIEEFQTRVAEQGKIVLGYTADLVEWSARKNIDIAKDFAGFTVGQLRLPVEADGFADYRASLLGAYGDFGGVLKAHGKDYADRLRGVPAEVRELFVPKKPAARKAPAGKKAKVATGRAPAARKTAAAKKPAAARKAPAATKTEPTPAA